MQKDFKERIEMEFKLLQCIRTVNDLDVLLFNDLSIGIEIQDFFNTDLLDGNWQDTVNGYQQKIKDLKGTISIHGPFLDLKPGSPDKRIADVTKDRYFQAIKIAKSLKASRLVFHSQLNPTIKDPQYREYVINAQLGFWEELLEEIQEEDMFFLIENIADYDYEFIVELVKRINSPKVKVCLDVGHVLCNSHLSIEDWIQGLGSDIKHIHLHWNDKSNDLHLSPPEEFIEELFNLLQNHNIDTTIAMEYDPEDVKDEILRIRKASKL